MSWVNVFYPILTIFIMIFLRANKYEESYGKIGKTHWMMRECEMSSYVLDQNQSNFDSYIRLEEV